MKNYLTFVMKTIPSFIINRKYFLIVVSISIVIINCPVIFSAQIGRPFMIDVTAIVGAVATAAIFSLNTLLRYFGRWQREGFLAFTVGSFLWLGAEVTWAYYREGLGVEVPYPSTADLLWLIGYGFFLVHNYKLMAKLREVAQIDRSMIILVSVAVGLTLGYILNLTFGIAEILSSTTDTLSTGVSIFYPIIDGIILIPAMVIFWSLRRTDPSSIHWLLISASFIMVTIGDIGFGYSFALSPDIAGEYEWIWSIFFNACYVCMAAGGLWYCLISRQKAAVLDNTTRTTLT